MKTSCKTFPCAVRKAAKSPVRDSGFKLLLTMPCRNLGASWPWRAMSRRVVSFAAPEAGGTAGNDGCVEYARLFRERHRRHMYGLLGTIPTISAFCWFLNGEKANELCLDRCEIWLTSSFLPRFVKAFPCLARPQTEHHELVATCINSITLKRWTCVIACTRYLIHRLSTQKRSNLITQQNTVFPKNPQNWLRFGALCFSLFTTPFR